MARAVEQYADHVIVTSDNPRHEDPHVIIRQVTDGFERSDKVESFTDRRQAIRHAMTQAATGDVILVAGKGHESCQIIGDVCIDFDDRQVARELLANLNAGVNG
jgi:UDP-N-acetylmuramoyl-L-alanyl-D-glutamate--2,6-diaminopimelate ligase